MQLWVAQTLRSYVTQLRAVPYSPNWSGAPGPFNQTDTPLSCPPMWIFTESGAGPFDSYDAMTRWFDTRRTRLMLYLYEVRRGELPEVSTFDNSDPLVVSHGDLNMRNILLEKDQVSGHYSKIWLIDWDYAGFYPPSMEYAFMLAIPGLPQLWMNYVPFIAGSYHRQYEFFRFLQHGFLALV